MISKKERRRAVAELRKASTGAYRHVDSLDVIAGAVGVEVAGKFGHNVENEAYAALADFIDRPTCCLDLTDVETYGNVKVRIYECSKCGRTCEEIYGKYERCPYCGAEVIDEDSAN